MKKNEKKCGISFDSVPQRQQDKKQRLLGNLLLWILGSMFLISLGGMVFSLLSLAVYGVVLGIWGILCVGLCLFFYERPKYRLWLAVGGVIFLAAVILLGGELFRDGLGISLNGVKDLFGMAFSRIYLPFEVSGNHNEAFAVTVFMLPITLMFSVLVSYVLLSKGRAVLLILLLCLFFALIPAINSPNWVWYTLFAFSLVLLLIVRVSGIVNNQGYALLPVVGGMVALVLFAVCLLPTALQSQYEKPQWAANAETSAMETLESFLWRRDGTHNLPEGQFDEVSSLVRNDTPALEVTMSELSSLYLRGYVGTVYSAEGWKETDKETLFGYADLFYWLHDAGFYGTSQIAAAAEAAGVETDEISVAVKNLNAKDKYIYSPYEYRSGNTGNAAFRIGDTAPCAADYEDQREFSYTMSSNLVRNSVELAAAVDEKALAGDETVLAYLECENAYREYVYKTSLNVPKEVETVLQSHFGEPDLSEGHEDYDKVMQEILNELLTSVNYNEEVGDFNGNTDFVRYFLENSAEGYSVHYATAAAMIFRYYGIPARYVEGYIIEPDDLFGLDDGDPITLTGENAHAWVEYYRDGVGWIPFEVTPPYLFIMELPEQMKSYVSDHMDSLSNQSGMLQMEEDNYEDAEEEDSAKTEDKDGLSPWFIILILLGILILLVLSAVFALMIRRRICLRRRAQQIAAADDRSAVDMILCDCLKILFAVGLERKNGSLEEYVEPLKNSEMPNLGRLLEMMIGLQREAMFSDHEISSQRRRVFLLFHTSVVDFAEKRSSFVKRWIHRYIRNLY